LERFISLAGEGDIDSVLNGKNTKSRLLLFQLPMGYGSMYKKLTDIENVANSLTLLKRKLEIPFLNLIFSFLLTAKNWSTLSDTWRLSNFKFIRAEVKERLPHKLKPSGVFKHMLSPNVMSHLGVIHDFLFSWQNDDPEKFVELGVFIPNPLG